MPMIWNGSVYYHSNKFKFCGSTKLNKYDTLYSYTIDSGYRLWLEERRAPFFNPWRKAKIWKATKLNPETKEHDDIALNDVPWGNEEAPEECLQHYCEDFVTPIP